MLPLPRSATIGEQLACIWLIANHAHCSMGSTEVTSFNIAYLAVTFNYAWRIVMSYLCAIATRRAPCFKLPRPSPCFPHQISMNPSHGCRQNVHLKFYHIVYGEPKLKLTPTVLFNFIVSFPLFSSRRLALTVQAAGVGDEVRLQTTATKPPWQPSNSQENPTWAAALAPRPDQTRCGKSRQAPQARRLRWTTLARQQRRKAAWTHG